MRFSSSFLSVLALASQALAFPLNDLPTTDSGLEVKLTSVGNTRMKAVLTNTADHDLSFLKFNTFFDDAPTQKVRIAKDGSLVPFNGIHRYYNIDDLPQEAFIPLAPGESVEAEFDIAETSDLSAGGSYKIFASGVIPIVAGPGIKVTSAVSFSTDEMTVDVDGAEAAQVQSALPEATLDKRTRIDRNTCTGNYYNALARALQTAAGYASRAAQAAQAGNRFQEFFKTTSPQVRQNVAARFSAIAQECRSPSGGRTTYHCQDVYRACQQGIIAYTIPARSAVVNCPPYWRLPAVVNQGFAPDMGYVVVHEFAHAPSIFRPGTVDHAYGYAQCVRLNSQQALSNADNYALFAAAASRR
ncbi:predicted protein [Uncinocarpus reesii 1704]|uniref:Neutral protease 2 homolog UREG_03761 n=1 Tax=Uncinocarpus reesii (strain UAMH 1704) TaxID=336963 RepID=NPIIA_UNCRE|nr:uncharacterized protein UREG_03761 [Uncinocarpus reesii 1704]C4JLQ3.1 RecName: Full=Neutral protease 2 homolog UREG_03761; AltName: Full=Deuterolysin UREG_03761; Flags: Precursor [Uncinocarpus reesii 1704]EEP78915.1 predicted protein [Uncinocarpus reesii 1704]